MARMPTYWPVYTTRSPTNETEKPSVECKVRIQSVFYPKLEGSFTLKNCKPLSKSPIFGHCVASSGCSFTKETEPMALGAIDFLRTCPVPGCDETDVAPARLTSHPLSLGRKKKRTNETQFQTPRNTNCNKSETIPTTRLCRWVLPHAELQWLTVGPAKHLLSSLSVSKAVQKKNNLSTRNKKGSPNHLKDSFVKCTRKNFCRGTDMDRPSRPPPLAVRLCLVESLDFQVQLLVCLPGLRPARHLDEFVEDLTAPTFSWHSWRQV